MIDRSLVARAVLAIVTIVVPTLGHAQDPVRPAEARRVTDTAGSVETGLQILAEEIVAKSVSTDRRAIAVLPFPNADNTCSVLSNYLVDELIQALFSVPDANLRIIERNQLMAVFNNEVQLGESGLLDPATTRKVGSVTGAQGLVIGSIAQIGDRIRINARIISTENAFTISAAAVTVPRTGDIDALLRQPVVNENGVCGARAAHEGVAAARTGAAPVAPVLARDAKAATLEGIVFAAQMVSRSADKKSVSVMLSLTNQTDQPMQVALVSPKPAIIDSDANQADAEFVNGIQTCSYNTSIHCRGYANQFSWTTLSPGLPTNLLLKFSSKDVEFSGNKLSLAASLLKSPGGKIAPDQIKDVSVSLANLPLNPGPQR